MCIHSLDTLDIYSTGFKQVSKEPETCLTGEILSRCDVLVKP